MNEYIRSEKYTVYYNNTALYTYIKMKLTLKYFVYLTYVRASSSVACYETIR